MRILLNFAYINAPRLFHQQHELFHIEIHRPWVNKSALAKLQATYVHPRINRQINVPASSEILSNEIVLTRWHTYDLQNQNSWLMPLRSPCKLSTSDRLASSHSSRILWRIFRCFGHVISGCRAKNAAQGIVYWCCGGRTVGCEERSYTLYEKAAFQCRW